MVRKTIPNQVKQEIKQYIQILKQDKLPITKAILYGSYAKNKQNEWSDIDLCIVSPRFKNSFSALNYLWMKRKIFDPRYAIEPIGFTPQDFTNKYDSLINEIKTTGIEIKI